MNHDPETRCGKCHHPRRLHSVSGPSARRVGCVGTAARSRDACCGCPRLQSDEPFDVPGSTMCVVCGREPVAVEDGFDTCEACLAKQ